MTDQDASAKRINKLLKALDFIAENGRQNMSFIGQSDAALVAGDVRDLIIRAEAWRALPDMEQPE